MKLILAGKNNIAVDVLDYYLTNLMKKIILENMMNIKNLNYEYI